MNWVEFASEIRGRHRAAPFAFSNNWIAQIRFIISL